MEALVVLIGSFAISWISVDLSIRAAKRVNAYDHPDGGRKVQERPIPRLGGLAIAGAFTVIIAIGLMVTGRLGFALALGVLIPALVAAAIGGASATVGCLLSAMIPKLAGGPTIVLAGTAFFVFSMLFGSAMKLLFFFSR